MKIPCYRQVAVLGAGTMGAQIAAHFANAGIPVLLFDLPGKKSNPNEIVTTALQHLCKLNPEPLASQATVKAITPCHYGDDLEKLSSCDCVIEAVAEQVEIKTALYRQIAPYLSERVILGSNTSGLSINALAKALPKSLQKQLMGIHFFNPPRYLPLVELVASQKTDTALLDEVETFLTSALGKSIVRAKDTPNFIANRIGVFSILTVCHYAEQFNIPLEVVDQLTGERIGRPKSATFRTADLVGLDVLSHVIDTLYESLPKNDPWHMCYAAPSWIKRLIKKGALGQKSGQGIYQKTADGIEVLDLSSSQYRPADQKIDDEVTTILKESNITKRFEQLRKSKHPQAQFLWSVFRDIWQYAAVVAKDIADNVCDIDLAMRLGFGWQEGPFEIWQRVGWRQVNDWINADIKVKKTRASKALPHWVNIISGPYQTNKAYDVITEKFATRRKLPVYQRQLWPLKLFKETQNIGKTLFENEGARLWQLDNDGITILSFKTKMGAISDAVLEAIQQALIITAKDYQAMVIYQTDSEQFSVGADLKGFAEKFMLGGAEALKPSLELFQQTMLKIRYAPIPVIAATRGYVLGGGCEMQMHCDHTVAALNSYVGLVEVAVGIIPGAGGTKEMTLRATQMPDPEKALQSHFKQIAMAEVAKSAVQAKEMHYLRTGDTIVMHPDELLYVAKSKAREMIEAVYEPPIPPKINVQGRDAKSTLQWFVINLREGGFASEFDYHIVMQLANIMVGGDIDRGSEVNEEWLLRLEREAFLNLVEDERTHARMEHMLTTGKPLRN